ncbi:MAG: glycoside hydrolase family 25 protein, partial [Anaerolineales bacterium]|nr:glycoside hydrolase family 25 protein [Anaerolineales bacterium]
MIKSEKVFLFLLISICLFVSIILVDAVIDPAVLISTVFASANNSPELVPESLPLLTPEEATQIIQDGWEVFRSDGYAFEIQFPKAVVRKTLLNQDALNAGIGVDSEAPVWEFTLDNPALYQGTNLVDASLVIHVLKGEQQIGLCSEFKPGSIYQTPSQKRDSLQEVDINGIPFWKDEVLEGVMGGMYRLISYRTVANGACYELTQLVHYQNSTSFLEGEITPFDEKQVLTELDQVLDTFSLLDVEPTFPEQSYPLPKTMSFAAPKNISDHVDGIDVSHWQGDIKWRKVGDAGIEFAFVKGTEGVGWTDVNFHENMNSGQDSGVVRGVYHFARPNLGNSGAEEANYFLSVAGDYLNSGYLRPVLDLEVGSSLGKTALSNWVLDYMETIKNRTGIEPLIYTNLNYVNNFLTNAVTDYDLWIAYWSCEPEPTYFIPPTGKWSDWAFWQYFGPGGCGSNAGFIPGIQTDIDLNIFNGVSAGLQEYDASSHLWVSMSSDAYFSPIPYYADISANVNGDTTGPIDFSFWWDCDALEADVATVESACGVLPAPEEGQCQQNEYGQKCNGV